MDLLKIDYRKQNRKIYYTDETRLNEGTFQYICVKRNFAFYLQCTLQTTYGSTRKLRAVDRLFTGTVFYEAYQPDPKIHKKASMSLLHTLEVKTVSSRGVSGLLKTNKWTQRATTMQKWMPKILKKSLQIPEFFGKNCIEFCDCSGQRAVSFKTGRLCFMHEKDIQFQTWKTKASLTRTILKQRLLTKWQPKNCFTPSTKPIELIWAQLNSYVGKIIKPSKWLSSKYQLTIEFGELTLSCGKNVQNTQ